MIAFGGYQQANGYIYASSAVSGRVAIPSGCSHLFISNLSTTTTVHVALGDATVAATIPVAPAWGSGHIPPGGDVTLPVQASTHVAFISAVAATVNLSAVIPHGS